MKLALALACLLAAAAVTGARPLDAAPGAAGNETACDACTRLLTLLQARASDPTVQQELMQYVLEEVCPNLPADDQFQCRIFAPMVIASSMSWLREQSPALLCARAALCPSQQAAEAALALAKAEQDTAGPGAGAALKAQARVMLNATRAMRGASAESDDCDTCKIAVLELANILADPDTQKEILEYAAQACATFPAFQDQCLAYVQAYGPAAFATAIAYLQPALCESLGFCPVPPAPPARALPLARATPREQQLMRPF